jgi:1-acyl-sn-glycerol-3-phosphate acyltransferase
MAGRGPKGRSGGRKGTARAKGARAKASGASQGSSAKPTTPALGNDPFTRGAAARDPAPPAAPRLAAPAAVAPPAHEPSTPPRPSLAEAAASASARLADFERRAESTLEGLEHRLHDLAGRAGLESARDELRVVLARLMPVLLARLGSLVDLVRLLEPAERLDRFGMDPRLVERAAPLLELLYATWWRVDARYLDRIPAAGPALVVANHAGALPWDALVLRHALRRERPGRELRPLLDDRECALPVFGTFAIRAGAVRASPDAAETLLRDGALVGVFPEGSAASQRPWRERYRIQRFGRGGFAKLAFRAGVPIVPCAIVGAEEATPPIARSGWLAERLGLPLFSGGASLRLGAAGLVPLPSKWTIRFGDPIAPPGGPEKADDPSAVMALTETVRSRVQAMLDEDLAGRRSVFL